MSERCYNVLFLCTHNSARSVLAESILQREAPKRFRAYSAGSQPSGTLNLHVVEFLREHGYPTEHLRSKAWDEFAIEDAPKMDFVVTVCDQAAGEVCPVWPGQPVVAHWGVEDPSRHNGDPARARDVVRTVAKILERRIELLTALPVERLDRLTLERQLRDIGRTT